MEGKNNHLLEEDYDEIIHPDFRHTLNEEDCKDVVVGDSMEPEEFAETGAVIVYTFSGIALAMLIFAAIYFLS